jgi:NTP pyrophosphatase (non-canonical NTP hydrolase)
MTHTAIEIFINDCTEWAKETFPTSTPITCLEHLKNEIEKELIPGIEKGCDNLPEEFADCFILLMQAAKRMDIPFFQILVAANAKMEINKKRVWGKPNEKGFTEHVK